MPDRWVVNASPLIVLAKINHQHLLSQLADEIAIPQAVVEKSMPDQKTILVANFCTQRPIQL